MAKVVLVTWAFIGATRLVEISASSKNSQSSNGNDIASANYVRGCYFTNWAQYRNGLGKYSPDPEFYRPGLCTHILYAFATMDENSVVKPMEWNDESTEWSKGQFEKVNQLKSIDPNLKTLLSIGGWTFGTEKFKKMCSSAESRQRFINSAILNLRKWNFDGFDIDWEYPDYDDRESFTKLLQEVAAAFETEAVNSNKDRLLLTAAVAASEEKIRAGYDVPQISSYLDLVFLMTYDYHGAWEQKTGINAPLYPAYGEDASFNVDGGARVWLNLGMPREKLIIGIATYGRGWTLSNPKNNGLGTATTGPSRSTRFVQDNNGVAAYYEICEMLKENTTQRFWQKQNRVPYIVKGDQWFTYDDEDSIREKMKWLKTRKLGGAFVWTLDFDDFTGYFCTGLKYPLLTVILRELAPEINILPEPTKTTTKTTTESRSKIITVTPRKLQPELLLPKDTGKNSRMQLLRITSLVPTTVSSSLFTSQRSNTTTSPRKSTTTTEETVTTTITDEGTTADTGFICNGKMHRDPNDCSKFYVCAHEQNYTFNCAPGTLFNTASQACDHPFNVKC